MCAKGIGHPLARPVEGQDGRRHRHRVGHRRPHGVPWPHRTTWPPSRTTGPRSGRPRTFVAALQHKPDRVRDDHAAHRRCVQTKGDRLLGHQPRHHEPGRSRRSAASIRPPASSRRRAGSAHTTRPPCRTSSTRWWRRCTGSHTHSAAQIADAMPQTSSLTASPRRPSYSAELARDKGQFLPDGMMPASGPSTALTIEQVHRQRPNPTSLSATYTNRT